MLSENDIIRYVCQHLEDKGYDIKSTCLTSQHGYDIIAEKNKKALFIEAKGQTSANKNSNRYGKEFNHSQKVDHVAKAVYKTMKTKNKKSNSNVAIAFPSDKQHRNIIENIFPLLKDLGIKVYLVNSKGKVILL